MLIIGAGGLAREVLSVIHEQPMLGALAFYDDYNTEAHPLLLDMYPIVKNSTDLKIWFDSNGSDFTLGLGGPGNRQMLYNKIMNQGGNAVSVISRHSRIGINNVRIGDGATIMPGAVMLSDVHISRGCLVNYNATIGHDSVVGEYTEICPGVNISGRCTVGKCVFVGANATLLPGVTVGDGSVVGAGAVVTKDIPAGVVAIGSPARITRALVS